MHKEPFDYRVTHHGNLLTSCLGQDLSQDKRTRTFLISVDHLVSTFNSGSF